MRARSIVMDSVVSPVAAAATYQFGALPRGLGRAGRRGRAAFTAIATLLISIGLAANVAPARAAGFDMPSLYTARHQGMGGTAIGYVDDPSAAFHNPAGLQGVHGLQLLGDFSLILAHITGSPAAPASARGIQSNLTVAPLFMAAAAYRVRPWLSVGLALFPGALGGAEYEYPVPGTREYELNDTSVSFLELTPSISLNVPKDSIVPGELAFGVGYRMSLLDFDRLQGPRDNPRGIDLELQGTNFTGVRLGLQYKPAPAFAIGVVYRNAVEVTTRSDEGILLGNPATDIELPFVLPAQAGAGVRVDLDRLGMAVDMNYTFQSQNDRSTLSSSIAGTPVAVPYVFDWQDAFTWRFGFEYRLGLAQEVPIRIGYIHDGAVSSRRYPSAYTISPTATHTFTTGAGYDAGAWQMNLALTLGSGSTELTAQEIAPPAECPTCDFSGEYATSATSVYVDFSANIDL